LLAGHRSCSPSACSSWRDVLQILASSSCLQVSTSKRYREGGNISLKKSLLLEEGKQKKAQAWRKSYSRLQFNFWLSVGLFFLMSGGSGLPFPQHNWYITRIFLADMLEGWATQSPVSQEFF
jgi:hypothetical protein